MGLRSPHEATADEAQVSVLLRDALNLGCKSGQTRGKDLMKMHKQFQLLIGLVGPEGLEPPTKRL